MPIQRDASDGPVLGNGNVNFASRGEFVRDFLQANRVQTNVSTDSAAASAAKRIKRVREEFKILVKLAQ